MKKNEDWKTNRRKLTWNGEVIAWIVIQKSKGKSWEKIAKSYNRKYKHNTTGGYLYTKYRQTLLTGKVTPHKAHLTPEEEVFLNACFLNNFSNTRTLDGFEEQFGVRLSKRQLSEHQKRLVIQDKIQHENMVEKQIEKRVNNMKKGRWTTKETEQLMACKNRQDVVALARKLKRSVGSAEQKWYKAKKTVKVNKPEPSPKPQKKTKKNWLKRNHATGRYSKEEVNKLAACHTLEEALNCGLNRSNYSITGKWNAMHPYQSRWTQEKDFDLLCNFYELSIDEARKRYNRTYSQIAGRLEMLVDSAKPEHISMLMKAAEAIKSRKEKDSKPVKLSRKEKRMAKKQAKKDKKIAKAQAKLDKMRGE